MYKALHVKCQLLLLSDFNENSISSTDFFFNNMPIQNFMKIRLVGAELFHAD